MMRILVPLDGSTPAEYALGPAAQIARQAAEPTTLVLMRAEAMLPMVISPIGMGIPVGDVPVTDRAECAQYLTDLVLRPTLAGVTVATRVASGPPVAAIGDCAQIEHVDLIIMTSHGRTGIKRAALGSIAEAVMQQSHVPTLILHPKSAFDSAPTAAPLSILVPLDGSALAEASLRPACLLARALHGSLLLVEVFVPPTEAIDDNQMTLPEAEAYLEGYQRRLCAEGITTTFRFGWGDPATEICAIAATEHCDLLAIATHGRTGLTKLAMGSVATTILRQMQHPVLLTNPPPA